MTAPRLLLLSNSRIRGREFLDHARDEIKSFLGAGVRNALFVPYAGVTISWDDYAGRVSGVFNSLGYHTRSLHGWNRAREAVDAAEAIVVGGGNSFHLLKALYDNDVLDPIRARVAAGVPYMGWSAGANVACPTIKTTNDMPIVEPPSFDALGLVPFQINPHYTQARLDGHQGETRDDRLAEFVTSNPSTRMVGLREGSMLRVEGREISLLGEHDLRAFGGSQEPREVGPGESLSFLLEPLNAD